MRTTQEQKIEEALFELIKNAGKLLRVYFVSQDEIVRNGRVMKTSVNKYDLTVALHLVEPTNPAELNEWADAIVKAEELIEGLIKERYHEYQNPNYFKAIIAKYNGLEYQPNNYTN